MSDEYEGAEQRAAEQAASEAVEPSEAAGPPEAVEPEAREPQSPEEQAFFNVLHQRKQITESLQNGSLSCLPGDNGYADTSPAVNLVNGTHYHGANLLYLKDFQKRNGFPTSEYATQDAVQKSGIPIRKGEHGVSITFDQKSDRGEWEKKNVRLFNAAQLSRPWEFKKYAEGLAAAEEQRKQEFLKSQYGESYQPKEKQEKNPGPEITCSSTEPDRYLAQYFTAVSLGGAFKVTPQQAGEFAEKMQGQLYAKDFTNSNGEQIFNSKGEQATNPFKLSKICNLASAQCKEIIKDIKQPKQEQTQKLEHKQSRHM